MIDFRYHALSIVAVFLALAIGFLLGATVGDSLVSSADRGLRSSLRADLQDSRTETGDLREQVDRRDRLIAGVLPELAQDRLSRQRVAIVASGTLPDDVEAPAREAVEVARGTVDSVSVLDATEDVPALAAAEGGRRPADHDQLRALGRRVGRELALGRPARPLERALPDRIRGDLAGADAVVFYRTPDERSERTEEQQERDRDREALEQGLVDGLTELELPLVGVEASETDPSDIPWYRGRDLTTVDSVNTPAGQLALVYALDGAEGQFGLKDTAERPLPDLSELGG